MAAMVGTAILAGCSHEELEPGPQPNPNIPTVDVTPPVITIHHASVDITGVEEIRVSGSQLKIGGMLVAEWTDNVSKSCQVKMTFEGAAVVSGDVPEKS